MVEITFPNSWIYLDGIGILAGTGVKTLVIHENVKSIGQYLFMAFGCTTIICMPTTAPTISGNPWGWGGAANATGYNTRNSGTNKVYIPKGSTGYDASGWQILTDANHGFTFVEMEE